MVGSDFVLQFLKKLKLHTKLVPEIVHQVEVEYFVLQLKKNQSLSVGKIKIIVFDLGSVFFKKYYFPQQIQKKNAKCIIYYNNGKCFLVLVIYMFVMFYFFFLQKAKQKQKKTTKKQIKKSQWPIFCNIIFLFLLKVGSIGPVDKQINFILLSVFPLKFICDHFYITIIHKSIFF